MWTVLRTKPQLSVIIGVILVVGAQAVSSPLPAGQSSQITRMVPIPSGTYPPLYRNDGENNRIAVNAFELDQFAVTNAQFLEFVRQYPQWQRSQIRRLFADTSYLVHWSNDLDIGQGHGHEAQSPVIHVSWFAAKAYCQTQGKRLPTLDEWEYAASGAFFVQAGQTETSYNQWVLEWYSRPAPSVLPKVGSTFANAWGVYDLHGLIWEWVADFNSALVTGESRGDSGLDRSLFCGAGALRASDFKDYAAFMRYGMRSSLKANYTGGLLGFRCAGIDVSR